MPPSPRPSSQTGSKAVQDRPAGDLLGGECGTVLKALQQRVLAVIEAVPEPIRKSADLQHALRLDKALAWNVYNLATAVDPLGSAPFIPGEGRMKKFLLAAGKRGVPPELTSGVMRAFADFEHFVETAAADRASFVSMVRDIHGAEAGKDDLKHKRAAFRANRHIYGVHAAATVQPIFIHPSRVDPDRQDMVAVIGHVDIQQSRANTNLLNEILVSHGMAKGAGAYFYRPLPPQEATAGEVRGEDYLLKEFCTEPLPEFRTLADNNRMLTQARSRVMGSKGSSTYFFAHYSENPPTANPDPEQSFIDTIISVPTEVFVRDIWLHKSYWPRVRPAVHVYGRRTLQLSLFSDMSDDELATEERLTELGGGPGGVNKAFLPEMPRYVELVRHVADRVGWDINEFQAIRCRVEYPVMLSRIRVFLNGL